ncbi:MAG: AMP-binding protein [Myxococcota bacterium]
MDEGPSAHRPAGAEPPNAPADDAACSPSLAHNAGAWTVRWAEERPDALAWCDADRRLDWRAAEQRIRRWTDVLAREGLGPGDRIALWLGNRGALLEALLAAARLGAITLPVNGRLTPREVAFQLDDATPRILVSEKAWHAATDEALAISDRARPTRIEVGGQDGHCELEKRLVAASPTDRCEAVSPEDPMILMYTSGTTGKPKGALLPHRKSRFNGLNAARYFDLGPEDRVLVVAPLFHSLALQILALPAIQIGAGLVLQEGFDPIRAWRAIADEGVTYYGGVPTMHQRMLAALDRGEPFERAPASLRFAFTAGAAAPVELIRAFEGRGLRLVQGYGQTETSILTCLPPELALAKAGSVGRPVHHAEIRLVAPDRIEGPVEGWRDVAPGEVGEVVVRGPITMLGYWQRPEATAATLRGEWLRTGDLATRDADFDITLVGRAREMYISGGENVYPAEVEAALVEHPDVVEAAVVAIPDREWGEVGRAYVVLREGADLDREALAAWLASRLARYKQPREIVLREALPRTASGKVQKHRL